MKRGLHVLGGAVVRRGEQERTVEIELSAKSVRSIGAGILGAAIASSLPTGHPIVVAIDGYEFGSTAMELHDGRISKSDAARRLGRAAIATAATFLLPIPGFLAWLTGAIAAHVVIPDSDDERAIVQRARDLVLRDESEESALVRRGGTSEGYHG